MKDVVKPGDSILTDEFENLEAELVLCIGESKNIYDGSHVSLSLNLIEMNILNMLTTASLVYDSAVSFPIESLCHMEFQRKSRDEVCFNMFFEADNTYDAYKLLSSLPVGVCIQQRCPKGKHTSNGDMLMKIDTSDILRECKCYIDWNMSCLLQDALKLADVNHVCDALNDDSIFKFAIVNSDRCSLPYVDNRYAYIIGWIVSRECMKYDRDVALGRVMLMLQLKCRAYVESCFSWFSLCFTCPKLLCVTNVSHHGLIKNSAYIRLQYNNKIY